MAFRIERARVAQVSALCAIERAAIELFQGHPVWPAYASMSIPAELLREGIEAGLVWVAIRETDDRPVGFIWLEILADDQAGICDFNVLPAHGRQGIGAALLEHACAWARSAGYRQVLLGTVADVPWNAPFYAQHGFVEVDKQDPAFAFALQRDRDNGFPDPLRVFMRRPLAAPAATEWTTWPAPAKLNLFLRIVGRRADGYHELQTVFRILDWGDEIALRVRPDGVIARTSELAEVPAEQDLVVRAARLLKNHTGCALGADIAVEKRVPMGGGLGGGSSDAATVLVALNALWQTGVDEDALAELGRQLGADVPVFTRGRSAWAEGIGEILRPISLPKRWYIVIDPREKVPTAGLFAAPELTRDAPASTISNFTAGLARDNTFEPVVRARHPRVAAALDWLGNHATAQLSGTGGCLFAELESIEQARRLVRRCPGEFSAYVAEGMQDSPLRLAVERHRGGSRQEAS
ncbi:4-(cytidine 5'-diphospho)-2-C-methyl-D-erythritol kinase [Frateuria aurantia]